MKNIALTELEKKTTRTYEIHRTWRGFANDINDEVEITLSDFASALTLTKQYNNEAIKYDSFVRYYWITKENGNEIEM